MTKSQFLRLACLLCFGVAGSAQTRVDQPTQIKGALKNGTVLPATCGVGEVYFKSNAMAGSNLFGCTASNTWTLLGGGSGSMTYPAGTGLAYVAAGIAWGATLGVGSANTANAVVQRDGSGNFAATTVTANLTGNASGSAANITGLIVKANTPLTTKGDLIVTDGTNVNRLGVGTDAYVLTADSVSPNGLKWAAQAAGFADPLTTRGDIIVRGVSATTRLARGADGTCLTMSGVDPTWLACSGGGVGLPFITIYATSTTLTIGTNCTSPAPCTVRFGNTAYQFASSATATISAGTGTAYIYISSAGTITVGHNVTASCSGCTATGGVTSFPEDSIPLYTWTATAGAWNSTGGLDFRAPLSTKTVTSGTGLVSVTASGQTTMSVDTAAVGLRVAVPGTAVTACTSGSWAADANFFYVCYGTDTWRRAAVSSW